MMTNARFLLVVAFAAYGALPAARARAQTNVTIDPHTLWQDVGVDVSAGQQLVIDASGLASAHDCADMHDPSGCCPSLPDPCGCTGAASGAFAAPGLTMYSLVGKIGAGVPFSVGLHLDMSALQSGRLYLTFNDQAYGDNCGSWNATITTACTCQSGKTLALRDGAGSPMPGGAVFQVSRVVSGPPHFAETDIGLFPTDAEGRILLPACYIGDAIKISRILHREPARQHRSILDTAYTVSVDNATFSDATSAMSYDIMGECAEQTIQLGHTSINIDLVVSIEWNATPEYIDGLAISLRRMCNFLYDVCDGQGRVDDVLIYEDGVNWNSADMRIHANNQQGAVTPHGEVVDLPPKWYFDNQPLAYVWDYPLDFAAGDDLDHRTKAHELGHLSTIFGFLDEYWLDAAGNPINVCSFRGFMGKIQLNCEPRASEMSRTAVEYDSPSEQNTAQWARYHSGCADMFQAKYEKAYDGINARIIHPMERPAGELRGPNDNNTLDYDVGAAGVMDISVQDEPGQTSDALALVKIRDGIIPAAGCGVSLLKANRPMIYMGLTTDAGLIRVWGYNPGDGLIAWGASKPQIVPSNEQAADRPASALWLVSSGVSYDSAGMVVQNVRPISGEYPFVVGVDHSGPGVVFDLFATNHPAVTPSLEATPYDTAVSPSFYTLAGSGDIYSVLVDSGMGESGWMTLHSVDDSLSEYFVPLPYAIRTFDSGASAEEIFDFASAGSIFIEPPSGVPFSVLIVSSNYPPIRNGLPSDAVQGGAILSVSWTAPSALQDTGTLTIPYSDPDLGDSLIWPELSTRLFIWKWRTDSLSWAPFGGGVDTSLHIVTARVDEPGIYGAFAACVCRCASDPQCDGVISDVLDVVQTVNAAFRGIPGVLDPGCPRGRTDVDCGGLTDVLDVVHIVNVAFRGRDPATEYCDPCL